MAEEIENEIDLDELDESINKKSKVEERIKDLSNKVKITSTERDDLAKAKDEAEKARITAEKERDFYASFSDNVAKYPQASEYKEAIKEKVLDGYSVEDATVATLVKEGKFQTGTVPTARPTAPVGGSSVNPPLPSGAKPIGDMSREEKRAALLDAEAKGFISMS